MNTDTETSPQPAGLRGYRVLSRRDVGLVMLFFLLFECVALWSWYRNEHARLERGFMHDSEALYQQGSIHASYFHAWFPSSPEAVAHLMGGVPL